MSDDQNQPGIPRRVIYEAYLNVEEAHEQFRRYRDSSEEVQADQPNPQAEFQHAVLRFYSLLRPHIKSSDLLQPYWGGHIPEYPAEPHRSVEEAIRYYKSDAIGLYQEPQPAMNMVDVENQRLTDGGENTTWSLQQWHQALDRPAGTRLVSVDPEMGSGGVFIKELQFPVFGLRNLKYWKASKKMERKQGNGFMAGETYKKERIEYESPPKLIKAKRMLTDVSKRLNALPDLTADDSRDASFKYSDLLDRGESDERN